MKKFNVWVEEQLQKRQLITSLLRNLGYEKNALDQQDIIMSTRKFTDIENAINSLAIDDSAKEELIGFARNHRHEGLKNLTNKLDPYNMVKQDQEVSTPATLPQSNQPAPKPMNTQALQQQQMQQQQPNF